VLDDVLDEVELLVELVNVVELEVLEEVDEVVVLLLKSITI
jgi:hypothetical protein